MGLDALGILLYLGAKFLEFFLVFHSLVLQGLNIQLQELHLQISVFQHRHQGILILSHTWDLVWNLSGWSICERGGVVPETRPRLSWKISPEIRTSPSLKSQMSTRTDCSQCQLLGFAHWRATRTADSEGKWKVVHFTGWLRWNYGEFKIGLYDN